MLSQPMGTVRSVYPSVRAKPGETDGLRGQRARRSLILVADCQVCGRAVTLHGQQLGAYRREGCAVCGDECREARRRFTGNQRKRRQYEHKGNNRRALIRGAAVVEDVSLARLSERDGNRCHICRELVDLNLRGRGPAVATIDHIFPLALGGDHSYENTALAHKSCNSRKGARVA